jgi:hypothetical protein
MVRQLLAGFGGFDESFYPIWFEDVDFAAGFKRGLYLYHVPEAAAKHGRAFHRATLIGDSACLLVS